MFYRDRHRNYWYDDDGEFNGKLSYGWQHKSTAALENYTELLSNIYDFLFNPCTDEIHLKGAPPKQLTVEQTRSEQHAERTNSPFDLIYFLKVTTNQDLGHDNWKQLLFYCRIMGMEKQFVCDTLNAAYHPKDPLENARLWNSFTGRVSIGKGSIIRLLQKFAPTGWDETMMFPDEGLQKFKYYSVSENFDVRHGGRWKIEEVEKKSDDHR